MARPLRIEFSGALYHITARGNAHQDIFVDDDDRNTLLDLLYTASNRHQWLCHSYCLMSNHYHFLIETRVPSLVKGMKLINGSYTQAYNRRHRRVGHVLQGRYKAILVERDSYLLELSRYLVLNPVRAGMVRSARDWPWSSYRAMVGQVNPHPALTTDWLLGNFGIRKEKACEGYKEFVRQGRNQPSPWDKLKNQIYLGSDDFVEDMQCKLDVDQSLRDIPKPQKLKPVKPLEYYRAKYMGRNRAMAEAYRSGHYTLSQVGAEFGVSYATVSRAVKEIEASLFGVKCKA